MEHRLPPHVVGQFSPEDIVDTNAYVDDCACSCRAHISVADGLLNVHGRAIFDRILVRGNLHLYGDSELQRLPDYLAVTGSIRIEDCPNLKIMPSQMYAGEGIWMDRTKVRDLPGVMFADMGISMRECPNVLEIGEGVTATSLDATGCSSLKSIAPGLEFITLDLSGTPIAELPSDLAVKGELKLRNCSKLALIGEGATVERALDVRGCDMLFTLPNSIQPNIVVTDGMMLAYDRMVLPGMTGAQAGICLGFKAIEAFPHRHFKNLDRMQDPVGSIAREGKGVLKGRAVGMLKSDKPYGWQQEYFRRTVARLTDSEPLLLSGPIHLKRLS